MTQRRVVIVFMISLTCLPTALSQQSEESVRDFLRNRFLFSPRDLSAIDRGKIITEEIKTDSISEEAIIGAAHLAIPFEFAVREFQEFETLTRNSSILEVGRFHYPPRLNDMKNLTLEENDLEALENCMPGNCEMKLPSGIMKRFRTGIDWNTPDHQAKALSLAKQVFLKYVKSYLLNGNNALLEYDDQDQPRQTAKIFDGILQQQPSLFSFGPKLYSYLKNYSGDSLFSPRDIIYWQKEIYPGLKPTLTVNHVTVYTPDSNKSVTLIASKQIYANHYFEASLKVTALVATEGKAHGFYLLYLDRSCFDDLRKTGLFSFRSRVRNGIYSKVRTDLNIIIERIKLLYRQNERKKLLAN